MADLQTQKENALIADCRRQMVDLRRELDLFANNCAVDGEAPARDSLAERVEEEQRPRRLDFYMTNVGELGPYARWLTAIECILECAQERGLQNVPLHKLVGEEPDALRHLFGLHNDRVPARASAYVSEEKYLGPLRAILSALSVCFAAHRSGAKIEFSEFLQTPTARPLSAASVEGFRQWLKYGVRSPISDLSRLVCGYWCASNAPRREQMTRVVSALRQPGHGRPLVAVQSPSGWSGLSAFATEVLSKLSSPAAGLQAGEAPALLYVSLSRINEGGIVASRASVLAAIEDFLGIAPRRPRDVARTIDLADDLVEVRRALTLYPCVIVFDGIDNSTGPLSELIEVARDAYWPEFIRTLCQPHSYAQRAIECRSASRFLLLSGHPIDELRPWTQLSERLKPLNDFQDFLTILDMPDEVQSRLEHVRQRLGASGASPKGQVGFGLDPDRRSWLVGLGDACGLPDQIELAFVRLLSPEHLTAALHPDASTWRWGSKQSRQALFARWWEVERDRRALDLVAIKLIASSLSGMRITTLRRCIRTWLAMVHPLVSPEEGALLTQQVEHYLDEGMTGIQGLVHRHAPMLAETGDELVEALGPRQRSFELQSNPSEPDERLLDGEEDRRLIDTCYEDVRTMILGMIGQVDPATSQGVPASEEYASREWGLLNFVLAEESLRQATSQLRNLHSTDLENVHILRRAIQAIYHGLMSCGLDASYLEQPAAAGAPSYIVSMPAKPAKRYRYLYVFLYMRCVQGSNWELSRSFARSGLRLVIEALFLRPEMVRDLIRNMPVDDSAGAPSLSSRVVFSRTLALVDPDDHLKVELLISLGRTAYDVGDQAIVDWVVARLDEVSEQRSRLLAQMNRDRRALRQIDGEPAEPWTFDSPRLHWVDLASIKLRIDALQACGRREDLAAAEQLCLHGLAVLGIGPEWLSKVQGVAEEADRDAAKPPGVKELEARLTPMVTELQAELRNSAEHMAASDMLYRLAEVLATRADAAPDWRQALQPFLHAWVVYVVCDRARSESGAMADRGLRWSLISVRAARYFVRITMKVARILAAQTDEPSDARRAAVLSFFAHARAKLDVYARHHFRLGRERVSLLILEATAAWSWGGIAADLEAAAPSLPAARSALQYLDDAQDMLFELGYPPMLLRRFFFERTKVLADLGRQAQEASRRRSCMPEPEPELDAEAASGALRQPWRPPGQVPSQIGADVQVHNLYYKLAAADLDLLSRLTEGNIFWTQLVERQGDVQQRQRTAARI